MNKNMTYAQHGAVAKIKKGDKFLK